MDELARRNNQAADRFIASLTPQQRALAKVGALRADQLTPYQQSLAAEIKVPEGMSQAQASEYGRLSTVEENRERFQEGFQRGWKDADKQSNKLVWTCFACALRGLLSFGLQLACGLRDIGISYRLYLAALLSAGMLASQALALWFMMLACRIDLSLGAAAIVLLVVRLGTAIPNAPANVGSFQFFTVVGLSLFGEDKTVSAGFSMVYFFALTVPLWILGLLAISRTGMNLSTIRFEAAALQVRIRNKPSRAA